MGAFQQGNAAHDAVSVFKAARTSSIEQKAKSNGTGHGYTSREYFFLEANVASRFFYLID